VANKVIKVKTSIYWLFMVFVAAVLPAITLLGYQAYLSVSEMITKAKQVTQEVQIQELEHRIRAEQGRKCIIDGVYVLIRNESFPKPPECEAPDINDLLEELEHAKERSNP
jgi:hypothetical protein